MTGIIHWVGKFEREKDKEMNKHINYTLRIIGFLKFVHPLVF
jgi:hypothetical protein